MSSIATASTRVRCAPRRTHVKTPIVPSIVTCCQSSCDQIVLSILQAMLQSQLFFARRHGLPYAAIETLTRSFVAGLRRLCGLSREGALFDFARLTHRIIFLLASTPFGPISAVLLHLATFPDRITRSFSALGVRHAGGSRLCPAQWAATKHSTSLL
jgi:hypothetical protein